MSETIDRAIAAIAGPQHGVVTHLQLLDLGLTERMIWYRLKIGRLQRLHRGVYAVGHRPVSPHAHAIAAVLDKTTLADLIRRAEGTRQEPKSRGPLMYYI